MKYLIDSDWAIHALTPALDVRDGFYHVPDTPV